MLKPMSSATYRVPGMTCGHCVSAIESELAAVPGVESVQVELETKVVAVSGEPLDDEAIRAALEEAGYEAER